MGRKRRRRKLNPPPAGDPFEGFMQDLMGRVRNTVVQGVRQILMPGPTISFGHDGQQGPPVRLHKNPIPQPEPEAKPAQVISIRTET